MEKLDLRILALSYSQAHYGTFILVLTETDGPKKLPIIIRERSAMFISERMNGIKGTSEMQDLLKTVIDTLNATVQEIYIHSCLESVFYASLILGTPVEDYAIECSINDAMTLAVTFNCPITCSNQVMDMCGIHMNDDGTITSEQDSENKIPQKKHVSPEALQKLLEAALRDEDYEKAADLKRRIDEMKESH